MELFDKIARLSEKFQNTPITTRILIYPFTIPQIELSICIEVWKTVYDYIKATHRFDNILSDL